MPTGQCQVPIPKVLRKRTEQNKISPRTNNSCEQQRNSDKIDMLRETMP